MARKKYRNEAGEPLPGVTTALGVMGKPPLKFWAFSQGQAYERGEIDSLYEKRDEAADAGTLAHSFVETHLKGLPEPQVDDLDEAVLKKAEGCFLAYLDWEKSHQFQPIESELSLVSEKHGYGGTLDIAAVMGANSIVDIKTSKDVYFSMKVQVAAYKELWNENYPDNPIKDCHILRLGEDGGFSHHYYPNLDKEFECFLHCLAIWKILKETGQKL